ncbi:MAG: metallophosphoesterase family protein [Planctomycetota bacterium]|jgi:DNA repair exonuclease SbcCD nuclease subunit
MKSPIRVLFLADTHLGFDLPVRPRVKRRRRGEDFQANYERALEAAGRGEVDLVVHGGDVLYRSRVPADLVHRAFAPLFDAADGGVPVFVVPGNHERSAIPYPLLAQHPGVHIFDKPRTFRLDVRGAAVAVSGFPADRDTIRGNFPTLLRATGWENEKAGIRLLCLHQAVEGARVGVQEFTFRDRSDVIRGLDLPRGFAAFLSGHIHRFQVLTEDLRGRKLAAPVLYPGSVERTSFQEREETKGFLTLEVEAGEDGGRLKDWRFHELPARPMIDATVDVNGLGREALQARLRDLLAVLDPDAVVQIRLAGEVEKEALPALRAASLRALAPTSMNVTVVFPRGGSKV